MLETNVFVFILIAALAIILTLAGYITQLIVFNKYVIRVSLWDGDYELKWKNLGPKKKQRVALVGMAAIFAITPFLLIEFVWKSDVLLTHDRVIRYFPKYTVMWQWEWNKLSQFEGAHVSYLRPLWTKVSMSAHPITENPKVRSLRYEVIFFNKQSPNDCLLLEQAGITEEFDSSKNHHYLSGAPVKSLLYEFNEKHSKELATFYNPLDERQQSRFESLVRISLFTDLSSMGIDIQEVRFEMGE